MSENKIVYLVCNACGKRTPYSEIMLKIGARPWEDIECPECGQLLGAGGMVTYTTGKKGEINE